MSRLTRRASRPAASPLLALAAFLVAACGGGEVTPPADNPTPDIVALSPGSVVRFSPASELTVTGSDFVAASAVRVNGTARPTTFVSRTELRTTLLAADLSFEGSLQVQVVNPPPGGGASRVLLLDVVQPANPAPNVPVLTGLPSRGASAGRSGFLLTVHGRAFTPASVVLWNGAPRTTQYVSGTRLVADIPASDVASPGVAQVTVTTPAPGGGTSGAQTLTIRALGAATSTSTRVLQLHAADLAVDDARSLVYLSIRSTAPTDANNVVAIDPATGAVTKRVFAGSDPARLAPSHDGQFLYVGLNGASAVRRILLSSFTGSLEWSLASGEVAGELLALPGRAGSVVVSRQRPGFSPPLTGVTVYDDGVARGQSAPGHTGGNRLAVLTSPDTVYGFNNAHSGFEFFTILLDQAGARHAATNGGLIGGYYTQVAGAAGRIYGSDGSVVDAARRVKVGTLPVPFGVMGQGVYADPVLGRAFMFGEGGIAVYDINTLQLIGTVPVPNMSFPHPAVAMTRFVRWGSDGLAFLDADELFLVRSPLFGP